MTRQLEVSLNLPVRTYDIDFAGHVSNIVYIRWLEDLRLKMLDVYLPLATLLEQNAAPVLASTFIEYKRPITLLDTVTGSMWVNDIGRVKLTLEAEIRVGERVAARATQTGTFVSSSNKRPILIPEPLRLAYERASKAAA